MIRRIVTAAALLIASAAPVLAHSDPAGHGSLMAGVAHPLSGADHILAMVAVGLWAALLSQNQDRRARWMVPMAFVATMALGYGAALLGLQLPLIEPVILASVVVTGLLSAAAFTMPTAFAMAIVGVFAFFHGHAHGGEIGAADALAFGVGFALSTALLHAGGLALGSAFGKGGHLIARLAGGATAVGGLWLALAS